MGKSRVILTFRVEKKWKKYTSTLLSFFRLSSKRFYRTNPHFRASFSYKYITNFKITKINVMIGVEIMNILYC